MDREREKERDRERERENKKKDSQICSIIKRWREGQNKKEEKIPDQKNSGRKSSME